MTQRTGLDTLPPVTEDEALELCVHHLQLAAIYFNNVSDEITENVDEARRIHFRGESARKSDPHWQAILAFLLSSHKAHEDIKRSFDESNAQDPDSQDIHRVPDATVAKYLKP